MTNKSCSTCKHEYTEFTSANCQGCHPEAGWVGWEPYQTDDRDVVRSLGMDNAKFNGLVEELRNKSLDTLLKKNANYANEDRLHNFRIGAALIGGTPAQAALGYMAKHLASLIDKVKNNDFTDRDDLLEKCQDIINYICFIWCCGNE